MTPAQAAEVSCECINSLSRSLPPMERSLSDLASKMEPAIKNKHASEMFVSDVSLTSLMAASRQRSCSECKRSGVKSQNTPLSVCEKLSPAIRNSRPESVLNLTSMSLERSDADTGRTFSFSFRKQNNLTEFRSHLGTNRICQIHVSCRMRQSSPFVNVTSLHGCSLLGDQTRCIIQLTQRSWASDAV